MRLFATPSALSGAARTFDIGGTFDSYVLNATPEEADVAALAADFLATAEDFTRAAAAVTGPHDSE